MKYNWYETMSMEDQNDVEGLGEAVRRAVDYLRRDAQRFGVTEFRLVVSYPFGSRETPHEGKVVTPEEIEQIVRDHEWVQFRWESPEGGSPVRGNFAGVKTMERHLADDAEMNDRILQSAQESADMSGIVCFSWRLTGQFFLAVPRMPFFRVRNGGKSWHRVASHSATDSHLTATVHALCGKEFKATKCRYSDDATKPISVKPCKKCEEKSAQR